MLNFIKTNIENYSKLAVPSHSTLIAHKSGRPFVYCIYMMLDNLYYVLMCLYIICFFYVTNMRQCFEVLLIIR